MTPTLKMPRAELLNAMRVLRKNANVLTKEEVVLGYRDGCMTIALAGMGASVTAEGEWPGEARLRANVFLDLSLLLPKGDPLSLSVENGFLHIGLASFSCVWQEKQKRELVLPANPTLIDVLRLANEFTPAEIEATGVKEAITEALQKRDALTRKAAEPLKVLGVTEDDLAELVAQCVRR